MKKLGITLAAAAAFATIAWHRHKIHKPQRRAQRLSIGSTTPIRANISIRPATLKKQRTWRLVGPMRDSVG